MKALRKILTAAMAAVMSVCVFAACTTGGTAGLAGFVAVDINPGVEFVTDASGIVTGVRATNEDGRVLLSTLTLKGLTVEEATRQITETAEQLGFLNDVNSTVKLTVAADDAASQDELTDKAESGAQQGSDKAEIVAATDYAAEVEALKAQDPQLYGSLTVGKYRLILGVMQFDRAFTTARGAAMSVGDLKDLLEDYMDEYEDLVSDELELAFDKKIYELSEEIYANIDALYGEEYAQKAPLLRKLELLEEQFEYELENAATPETPVVPIESNDEDDDDEDDEDDNETLTADMTAQLTQIIGEHNIVTLDDLDDYIDTLEDELEDIEDAVELTDEQEKQLKEYKAQLKGVKAQAKELMHDEIEAAKAALREKSEQLKSGNK